VSVLPLFFKENKLEKNVKRTRKKERKGKGDK
jgi:hypothetical protein